MKKILGYVLIVLGVAAVAMNFVNGNVSNMGIPELIGFCAAGALCVFFSFKLTKK